ncbi:MAG: antibiotic biosynthesis monooxygenase [Pseudomonadales bacterium]|nr:antibiotic biosynthesis monooxygenase [Pseudomonadales bacterium]MCP5185130.1 antibiotic biosynthesis monooxygenase [Pseudomonadales bacterium]
MATLLARLKVRAGMEARWETMMAELVDNTLAHETGVIRYEYWKGQEPRTWYGLLSFVSKLAFFTHQDAPYHRDQPYGDCIEDMHLEWLDPVDGASPLPHTTDSPLPADTPDNLREWENRSPIQVADWWAGRR